MVNYITGVDFAQVAELERAEANFAAGVSAPIWVGSPIHARLAATRSFNSFHQGSEFCFGYFPTRKNGTVVGSAALLVVDPPLALFAGEHVRVVAVEQADQRSPANATYQYCIGDMAADVVRFNRIQFPTGSSLQDSFNFLDASFQRCRAWSLPASLDELSAFCTDICVVEAGQVLVVEVGLNDDFDRISPAFNRVTNNVSAVFLVRSCNYRQLVYMSSLHGIATAGPTQQQEHQLAEGIRVVDRKVRAVVNAVVCQLNWPPAELQRAHRRQHLFGVYQLIRFFDQCGSTVNMSVHLEVHSLVPINEASPGLSLSLGFFESRVLREDCHIRQQLGGFVHEVSVNDSSLRIRER